MAYVLILATDQGVVVGERDADGWVTAARSLADRRVTAIIAHDEVILAGTVEGVFKSEDMGNKWKARSMGLTSRHIRWLSFYPSVSDLVFAGTEPAGIFVTYDDADSWRSCPEVAQMRDQYGWSLPYSPQAGCVRDFAFHGQRAYAAVEDGGVLVSNDGGETWQLASGSRGRADHQPEPGFVHSDVHSIHVHPSSSDLVFAATGGGLFRSSDGGATWEMLYQCYCRAMWVDMEDPDYIVFGPADGVDRNGRVEVSRDGGKSWSLASEGLEVPWENTMVERFTQADDDLIAVLSNGKVTSTSRAMWSWSWILTDVEGVNAAVILFRE